MDMDILVSVLSMKKRRCILLRIPREMAWSLEARGTRGGERGSQGEARKTIPKYAAFIGGWKKRS